MRTIGPTSFAALLLALSLAAHGQDSQSVEEDAGPLEQSVPVADEGAEAAVGIADGTAALSPEDALIAEFAYFRELMTDRNYDAADASAKRVVEMAIRLHGPQSVETSKALSNLGLVQHNNKQFDAAIQNFMSSIDILEVAEDRLNEQLVNPLKGLGAAQLGSGRPDLAAGTFGRATHITHVNEGPHNIEQIELLESLAEANVRLGDIEMARDILDRIHYLNVRHFEDDALGLLPSLMRRADWQHRAGYYNDERATYRRTIRIIESSAGKEDPRLVTPLVKLGETFYYYDPVTMDGMRGGAGSSGETYFRRAVRIAEKTEDFPWLELATTKLALADYYAYFDGQNRARKMYQEVWSDLSVDEERIEVRKDLLERPISLREEQLPLYAGDSTAANGNAMLKGTIRADYTISTRGRVKSIRTEAIPAEFTDMQRMVHREIRGRFFRPPMVDGVPTEAGNQVYVHEFLYQQAELDALRQAATQEPVEKT
jgi:tetratricopeptide (TPR) repeat protein